MVTIGITGGIGSGKSVVCRILRMWRYPVYDSDSEAKRLMNTSGEIRSRLMALLGHDIYTDAGLDRNRMAALVFKDRDILNQVNAIVHPAVHRDFTEWAKRQDSKLVFLESAILYESGLADALSSVWCVAAPADIRIARTMARNRCSREEVMERISKQMSDEEMAEKSDEIIYNDDSHSLLLQLKTLLARYEK